MKFRTLTASEIDCRISTINERGLSLLLYKDARVDQNILDETVGSMNWQRHHSRDNANCIVSIWDEAKKQWIEKEDTGKESYTEAEKGLASDSFKRACFNWGIGRELYSAPFIWIPAKEANIIQGGNGKYQCYDRFTVDRIEYDDEKNIVDLAVRNEKTGAVYTYNKPEETKVKQEEQTIAKAKISEVKGKALIARCEKENVDMGKIISLYKVNSIFDLTEKQFKNIADNWGKIKGEN